MVNISSRFHLCYMQTFKASLKPVVEQYREKIIQMKTERKGKTVWMVYICIASLLMEMFLIQ